MATTNIITKGLTVTPQTGVENAITFDLDLKFKKHPIKYSVQHVKDITAINRALSHLFFTRPGERLYDVDFGIGLQDYLFDLNNFLTKDSLSSLVYSQINNYEPRINVIDFSFTPVQNQFDSGYHELTVNLDYSLRSNPEIVTTYEKTLKRIR